MTINLELVYIHISSRLSNLSFAHHFCYFLIVPKWRYANKNQHQESYQRETISDIRFFFFQNW